MTAAVRARAYVVDWRELPRWDLKSARAAAFRAAHPSFQRLGNFIEEATAIVHTAREPAHEWPVYGVNNKEGVVLSHHQKGAEFNAPYKRIREDWFFHNPTRANVGSLGRVPRVPPDAITSPEYQVWRIKHGLLPDFLEILIRLPFFLDLIECHRVGAVKERLFVENLCEIPIPVLDEKTQRAIVACWRDAQTKIAATWARVEKIEGEIQRCFLADLGLKLPDFQQQRKAFAILWQDFERWGVAFNQQSLAGLNPEAGKYPVTHLGNAIADLENGWSPQCLTRPAEGNEWGVLKLGAVSFGLFNDAENKALPPQLKPIPALEVKQGQVLISRANIPRLVGACALVTETRPRLLLCDKIFRAVFRDDSPLEPAYLAEVMKIPHLRRQIEAACTGTSPTMQNITKPSLVALRFPLPPLREQREIVARVAAGRAEIAREREADARLAREIEAEIEARILGSKH